MKTIKEVQEEKQELETKIVQMISKFENESNLNIDSVQINVYPEGYPFVEEVKKEYTARINVSL